MRTKLCSTVALAAATMFAGIGAAQTIEERLETANPETGESLYRQCLACHTIDDGGANRIGPNLFGVLGRSVASVDGFRYSGGMQELGGVWTPERLDGLLESPREYVSGTRMSFRGLNDPADRAAVIAYLNSQSDDPQEFSSGEAETVEESAATEQDFGQMFVAEGVDVTYYTCTACHSEMIVVQQGKTRDGWDYLLDWMVEEQGMAEIEPTDRDIILDYLAEHYNTDRPNFPSR